MRREAILAVGLALLLVTATPVSAAPTEELVVGGQHTTDSDFQNATTLENFAVSGGSLVLEAGGPRTVDDFEDGDLSEWTTYDSDSIHITSSNVYSGTYAMQSGDVSGTTGYSAVSESGLSNYPSAGDEFQFRFKPSDPSSGRHSFYFGANGNPAGSGTAYEINMRQYGDEVLLRRLDSSSNTDLDSTSLNFDNEWYRIVVDWGTGGTINIEFYDSSGSLVASLSGSDSSFSSGGVGVGSNNNADYIAYYDEIQINEDVPNSATYVSDTFDVSRPEEVTVNLAQVSDVSADLTAEYWDGSTWQQAETTAVTGAGEYTLTLPDVSADTWRVRADVGIGSGDSELTLTDDTIYFTNHYPEVDNASASPSGGETLTQSDIELSINVSDREFGTAQGEEITVEFRDAEDDSLIGTDTLSSNGTASTELGTSDGGENSWYAVVSDSYGGTATSDTFTFESPSSLSIYNETDHTELVDNASAEVVFYFGEDEQTIVERDASGGQIDMGGLSADESFIVVADAEGYLPRRIFVESLFETQEVYLLPEGEDYVERSFELQDTTGRYPADDSVLIIERNINGSWKTVQGDYFGAGGEWEAQLLRNERHRLLILNTETGDREPLGTVTPTGDGAQVIRVTEDGPLLVDGTTAHVSIVPQVRSLPADENASVAVELLEENATIANWTVTAFVETPGGGTETIFETTETEPGTVDADLNLTDYADGVLVVDVTWTTSEGDDGAEMATFSIRQQFENDYALLSVLAGIPDIFPSTTASTVTGIFALLGTFMVTVAVAASLPVSTEINGLVAVVALSVFGVIGWVTYDVVFAAGVGWLAFAGLRRGFR